MLYKKEAVRSRSSRSSRIVGVVEAVGVVGVVGGSLDLGLQLSQWWGGRAVKTCV